MDEIVVEHGGLGSNRLAALAAEIRAAHSAATAAAQTALDRARQAGKGLLEAKDLVDHGRWVPWLKDLGIDPRMAQRYMRLARMEDVKYDTVSHLTINQALAAASDEVPDPLARYGDALLRLQALKEERKHHEFASLETGRILAESIRVCDELIAGAIEITFPDLKRARLNRLIAQTLKATH